MSRKATTGRNLPLNITETNYNAYQVRITRNKVEHSNSFPWLKTGKRKALANAVKWRNVTLAALPSRVNAKGGYRPSPAKHKKTGEPVGVSRSVSTDYRRRNYPSYLRFSVLWADETGLRNKTFQAGKVDKLTQDDVYHARETARAFRLEWEWCSSNGYPFDPQWYSDWKNTQLYPFHPENR